MIHESVYELRNAVKNSLQIDGKQVQVVDADRLRNEHIDVLVRDAVFGTEPVKAFARWLIWEAGQALNVRPASIHEFYIARSRDEWKDRTVPAMNIRFTTYDTARAAIRAAQKTRAGAFIFEIARSEMGYTDQEPAEYSACLIAAAIKEGYSGPIFIQGDHFQVKASTYKKNPEAAIQEVKDLIAKAIPAGFWNIDIDTSTLVTLEPESLDEQQRHNYTRSAELTRWVRELEPEGVTVSLGGEIGEVGEKNSTPEELDAYIEGYKQVLADLGDNLVGLSKISVQTGTSHGGVVLPDGSIAEVAVDFEALRILGERARQHGTGGAVQHGASTLPEEMFHKFPEVQTLEIHLATGFQNLFMDHPAFPADLKEKIYRYLDANHADERKPGQTDAQFYYSTRKKAIGPFKPELWALPEDVKAQLYQALEDQFCFFYEKLNVVNTRELIDRLVTTVEYHQPMPASARMVGDDLGLAD
ncbi:class II fructose-bisphosphate aldolase [Litorilinea aerophila]|uniref:class II fructose-bisphosphate aldolase n=1 Tax=Litorilinea aerophila TaxID=1204385 RepID=UPI0014775253|nr:class II fructose-bisphosphate aldolase [Litorilinea aerophila]MCC9078172.1 class II fructose-bisphosphate aldolase [Litorilinea aerophila]GIV76838.1 MAG: aldolase [Litorilinea sp.]